MMYPIPPNPGCCSLKLPFVDINSYQFRPQQSYLRMLSYYFSPYFKLKSWSFLFIVITFLCLVIPQFIFPPLNLTGKLFSYPLIPGVYLNPIDLKYVSHLYIYKCFTTMFFHLNYTHWIGNVLGISANLFTMQFCWYPSIFLMLIGGTVTSAYFALIMNNLLIGFSGVIACSAGLFIGMFLGNWAYIKTHYPSMLTIWFANCVFVFLLLFNTDTRATMVHFIAILIGMIYSFGWIPKIGHDRCQSLASLICKVLSVVITVAPFIIIFSMPVADGKLNQLQSLLINTGILSAPGTKSAQPIQYSFQQLQMYSNLKQFPFIHRLMEFSGNVHQSSSINFYNSSQ